MAYQIASNILGRLTGYLPFSVISGLFFATKKQMADQNQNPAFNPDIEAFLLTSEMLEIDFEFGFAELNRYFQDILHLKSGVKFKDLGISERRHESMPRILLPNSLSFARAGENDLSNEDETKPGSIAMLKLSGVMRSQGGMSNRGIDKLSSDLRAAYDNRNIKGIILETMSGGGESMAGTILKSTLSEKNKPVIGFAHLAASAAYRALTGADETIASSPSAEFGSIGTMISLDVQSIEKFRERYLDIYGSSVPNKNGEFRKAIAGDFSGIQTRVDSLTNQFHKEIKRDRRLQGDTATVRETLSGSVFNAIESKKRGLIDAVGNLQFAIKRVNSLQSKY